MSKPHQDSAPTHDALTHDALTRDAHRAVIALGSNQGDREQLLRDAVAAIAQIDGVQLVAASGIVETPALKLHGIDEEAPSYLNAVLLAHTTLAPENLLGRLHGIEAAAGRVRDEVWGDRTLDLDLIAVDDILLGTDAITLPHPRAWQRGFVLSPWLQVQPDAVLPGRGPVAALLAETSDPVTDFPATPLWAVDS